MQGVYENLEMNKTDIIKNKENKIELDPKTVEILADLVRNRSETKAYLWTTLIGLLIGAFFSISGFIITVMGLSGSIEWILEGSNFKSKLSNAGPGAFFALLGFFILWRYKPTIQDRLELKSGFASSQYVLTLGNTTLHSTKNKSSEQNDGDQNNEDQQST